MTQILIYIILLFSLVIGILLLIYSKVSSLMGTGKRVKKMLSYRHVDNKNYLNSKFIDLFKDTLLQSHFDEDYKKYIYEKDEKIFIVSNEFGEQDSLYYILAIKNHEVVSEKKIVSFYVNYYTSSDYLFGDENNYQDYIFCHIYYDKDLKPSSATKKAMKEHVNVDTYSLPSLLEYKKAVFVIKEYKK